MARPLTLALSPLSWGEGTWGSWFVRKSNRNRGQPVNDSADADSATELAQQVGRVMFERDFASQTLGMRIEEIGPGYARLSMRVRRDMLNGHHTCQGGLMFALADSAFAFACNSRNEATVAAGCAIEFLRPVREGEQLMATAQERALAGRSGIYDVSVADAAGAVVALFRGKSHRIRGEALAAGVLENRAE